jgi:hypothetical protein
MMYGVWVYGVWCMSVWCMLMVYGVWCMVWGVWCVVYGVWCVVCGHNNTGRIVEQQRLPPLRALHLLLRCCQAHSREIEAGRTIRAVCC